MDLEHKTAIVTGAASGIGRAVALAYAREGANVIVSDIAEEGGRETVALIERANPGARSAFVAADASKPDDHEALVRAAIERFGALHVACNNAGIGGELNPVGDLSLEGWRKVIEVNLSGVYYAMHAQIPRMLEGEGAPSSTWRRFWGRSAPPAQPATWRRSTASWDSRRPRRWTTRSAASASTRSVQATSTRRS
jgi:NAD(P)-dependent dehydrogenase (short-subunit alcohol dehydrogenase family)